MIELPTQYGPCRALCHFWHPSNGIHADGAMLSYSLVCSTCETIRTDTIAARSGALLHRRYEYPSDYQLQGLTKKQRKAIDKAKWRREWAREARTRRRGQR